MKKKMIMAAFAASLLLSGCGTDKKREALPLEGTSWKLIELNGTADPAFAADADSFWFMLDAERKMVAGVGACNRLFGPYVLDGAEGIDIERLATTRMACPGMEREMAFTAMLEAANRYRIDGEELTLFDDAKPLATFRPGTPQQQE